MCHPRRLCNCTPEVPVSLHHCRSGLTDKSDVSNGLCIHNPTWSPLPMCSSIMRGMAVHQESSCQNLSSAWRSPCLPQWSPEALSSEQSALLFSSHAFYLLWKSLWKLLSLQPAVYNILLALSMLLFFSNSDKWKGMPVSSDQVLKISRAFCLEND